MRTNGNKPLKGTVTEADISPAEEGISYEISIPTIIRKRSTNILDIQIQPNYSPGEALRVPGGPRCQDNRHMKVVRLSALCTGRLYPKKYSWYSFLLEAEPTLGPWCGRKDNVNENFQ